LYTVRKNILIFSLLFVRSSGLIADCGIQETAGRKLMGLKLFLGGFSTTVTLRDGRKRDG
jgi:hypothetical protein